MCFLVEEGGQSLWLMEGLRGAQFLEGYSNTS